MAYDHSPSFALSFIQSTVFKEFRLHLAGPIHGLGFIQGEFLMNFRLHSTFPNCSLSFTQVAFLMNFKLHFPGPHSQPQFCLNDISHEFQAPLPLNVQIEPVDVSPSAEFTGLGEPILEKEIRELLFLLRPPRLPVESLANMYTDRKEQKYIVPAEDAPMYLTCGFKLGMPSGSSDPNTIYVTFWLGSKFTDDDVRNYFSQYGTVTDVRIPPQGGRRYGFVSFQDPGTAKQILKRSPHFICGDQVRVREYKFKHELEREPHYIVPVEDAPKCLAHGSKFGVPSDRSDPNQIYVGFMPESKFTEDDVLNYFRHYGPVKDVRIPPQKKRMFGYVSFKTLAREGAHSNHVPQEVSDVTIVHECHTGEQLASDHELFENKLNKGCDQEIVTEKSSTNVAPVMVSPPKHNLSVHLVSEASPSRGDNTTESHMC
nr:unnamed protein product [Digitaria exilis]